VFRASEQGQAEILQAALHLHGSTTCAAQSTLTDAHPPSTQSSALQLPCIHPYQQTADVEITILFLEFRCPAAATALNDGKGGSQCPLADSHDERPWRLFKSHVSEPPSHHRYPTANSHPPGTISVVEGAHPLIPAPMRSLIATTVEAASPQGSLYDSGI
jgi:hypothetical protein